MKVLLILGNGFDLNLGMPTSYRHFLKYYMDSPKYDVSENVVKLKSLINNDYEKWADLEVALGEVSIHFDNADDYIEAVENVEQALADYLSEVDNRFEPTSEMVMAFCRDLENFPNFFDVPQQHSWSKYLDTGYNDTSKWEYDIMSFNYTSSVEKIMKMAVDDLGGNLSDFKSIEHIHMTLKDGILMGVNDNSQISNSQLCDNYLVKSTIVKPFVNSEYDDGVDTRCRTLIDNADVVMLFGVSLGETDTDWWHYIGNSILQSHKVVIYCPYDIDKNILHKSQVLGRIHRFAEVAKNALLPKNIDVLNPMNDIFIIRENKMFDFRIDEHRISRNFGRIYRDLIAKDPIKTTSVYTR